MKALIVEKPERYSFINNIFKSIGVETTPIFKQGEVYDYVYIHYNGNFSLVDRIKGEQPNCATIGYSSIPTRFAWTNSPNSEVERQMREHFDEIIYWNDSLDQVIETIRKIREPTE